MRQDLVEKLYYKYPSHYRMVMLGTIVTLNVKYGLECRSTAPEEIKILLNAAHKFGHLIAL